MRSKDWNFEDTGWDDLHQDADWGDLHDNNFRDEVDDFNSDWSLEDEGFDKDDFDTDCGDVGSADWCDLDTTWDWD